MNASHDSNKNRAQKERDDHGRFVKGWKGGPGRPPVEFSPTALLRTAVAERPKVVARIMELAESEDENVALKALMYIVNRLDGMPKQAVEATGANGGPLVLKWDDGSDA